MKYKIEIWCFHSITDVYKSNTLEDILDWYMENWHTTYDYGGCTFYVFKNDKEIDFDELYKLGFYD